MNSTVNNILIKLDVVVVGGELVLGDEKRDF